MRQHPGPFAGIEGDFLEGRIRREIDAVKFRQSAVQVEIVRTQEQPEIGRVAADHVIEKQIKRGTEVRSDHLVELRIFLRVLGDIGNLFDLEPLQEQLAELGAGTKIADHALGLAFHIVASLELTGPGRIEQRLIGKRIPEPEREARCHVVAIGVAVANLAVEKSGRLQDQEHSARHRGVWRSWLP